MNQSTTLSKPEHGLYVTTSATKPLPTTRGVSIGHEKLLRFLISPLQFFRICRAPKVRVGNLAQPSIELIKGDKLIITSDPCEGTKERLSIDYPYLHEEVTPGKRILIDDGLILLKVVSVVGKNIETIVKDGGIIKPRKGVNLPDVALSFVRSAADVRALKDLMLATYGRMIPIISKIEKPEAGDVANAILDGTSAVMLSGETAAGLYPQRSVEIMQRIIMHTEASLEYKRLVLGQRLNREDIEIKLKKSTTEAVGSATRELTLAIKASYIACFTYSGGSAKLISKFRPGIPIIGFSPLIQTIQRLALAWGVNPVHITDLVSLDTLLACAPEYLKEKDLLALEIPLL